ncbi:Diacylglycerol kinase catalytic domain-containing protein [Roseovarius marisflavi]|uniref:Diacylglycerol kinase catalytic domain-containing protein n=1 Tax=Roseovarius marisflavi TaxID=1054996 RepID=A0A1M6WX54_9RHOB|nr:acylglycerol kinase family protein [Roseovarius marisflavi]SHK98327.1 Diacylglycerol kinase catalytic domain-containing protein [Roseovarius marisflavi]
MTHRIGLIVNHGSHAVEKRGAMLEAAALELPHASFLRLDDFADLNGFVRQMARDGVEKIFIEGGDGTLLAVLSACLAPGAGFASPPEFAILPGGSTNLAARSFGFRGKTAGEITRRIAALANEVDPPERETHRALRIESAALPCPAIGFVLSTGSLARAMLFAQREFHDDVQRGLRTIILAIVRFVMAPGKYRDTDGGPVLRASHLTVRGAGVEIDGPHTLALVTSLPRLSLGLKPFWGTGPGSIALTHAAWPIKGFRRAIAKILLHLSGPRLAAHGMTSYRSDRFDLIHDDPIVIDGEPVACAEDGKLHITTTEPLVFLR